MTVLLTENWESGWNGWSHDYGMAEIVSGGRSGNALRYTLNNGDDTGNSPDIVSKTFSEQSEVWGQFYVKHSSNWEWPSITDKYVFLWTAVSNYNAFLGTWWGNNLAFESQTPESYIVYGGAFSINAWDKVTFHAIAGSAGSNNGTMVVWVNDALVINVSDVPWRPAGSGNFITIALTMVWGGPQNTRTNGPYYIWYDDIIIGTTQADLGGSTDTIPDQFTFTDITGASVSTLYTSNSITVSGINASTTISISGNSGQYSKNSGAWTSSSGTVVNGDTVQVRQNSSISYLTEVSTTLSIGGITDVFSVTTSSPPVPSIKLHIFRQ